MKKTLKEIFEPYQIYNNKGELMPLLETELGKELFEEVNELNKSDAIKPACDMCSSTNISETLTGHICKRCSFEW